MPKVYMKWDGELKGDINNPLTDTVRRDPLWIPEPAPEGATLLATDRYDEEEEFMHGVWKGRIRVGGATLVIGVNVKFKGKIEYWVAEDDTE